MSLVVLHAVATAALAGIIWVVQLLVYPAFRAVGPTPGWRDYHADHSRRIALVVLLPWGVQGLTLAVLLVHRPTGPYVLVLLAAALGLATVLLTALVQVPLHRRLGAGWDPAAARRLVATNWWRTAAWTGSAVVGALLVARA